jgi:hypothetical protein
MAKRAQAKRGRSTAAEQAKGPRRKGRAVTTPPSLDGWSDISLRTANRTFKLKEAAGLSLARSAMEWTYVVGSRRRWSVSQEAARNQSSGAQQLLSKLDVDTDALAQIARAGIAEVSVDWLGEESRGWAARIMPWEYVVAAATSGLRRGAALTVVRHLNGVAAPRAPAGPFRRVLFVRSEPGILEGHYSFETERDLIRASARVAEGDWSEIDNPTADMLRDRIASFKPDIVHLAGFDTHQARLLLLESSDKEVPARFDDDLGKESAGDDDIRDGFVLAGPHGVRPVCAEDLAGILAPAGYRPRLVSFNIHNSAARCAPLMVAGGAHAAVGFQDAFNDELAELFFSVFYSRLVGPEALDISHAFRAAWERVRGEPGHHLGTGVVLWSATSAFDAPKLRAADAQFRRAANRKTQEDKAIGPQSMLAQAISDWIAVELQEHQDLNYSLLHNQRPLFEKFLIRVKKPGTLRGVRVKVSLSTGTETAHYERLLDVTYPFADVNAAIHVPLTSSITRSIRESVRTSLLIEVSWGDQIVYCDTKRVRLTPVDQWRDSDSDRKWLPSFVFPRDPAVTRLVDTAQYYMRTLRDDPAAGFDGYQSVNINQKKTLAAVDLQVQAIWSAIVHEMGLGYINPPPSYSSELDSQRLRTPSMIERDHSGTCIDLALFFAACLELIDIYPVVFLLEGHAFPGYWRASEFHDEFREARPESIREIVRATSNATGVFGAQREPWYLGKPTYREIAQFVNADKLVPIESVRLTEYSGFMEAIGAGRENLDEPREFEAMIDIVIAREEQLTPLPILGEQQ